MALLVEEDVTVVNITVTKPKATSANRVPMDVCNRESDVRCRTLRSDSQCSQRLAFPLNSSEPLESRDKTGRTINAQRLSWWYGIDLA